MLTARQIRQIDKVDRCEKQQIKNRKQKDRGGIHLTSVGFQYVFLYYQVDPNPNPNPC